MTIRNPKLAPCLFVSLLLAGTTGASAQEGLVYDPGSGDYLLTYDCGGDIGVVSTTLRMSNKIAPAIESTFEAVSGGIAYRYSVMLGAASRQGLRLFAFDPIQQVWNIVEAPTKRMLKQATTEELRRLREDAIASAPSGWSTFHSTHFSGKARVGWGRQSLPPSTFIAGSRQDGFTFSSRHLPAILPVQFLGDGPAWSFPCESPGDSLGGELDVLRRNNHVPRFGAAPVIRVPHPFQGVSVLSALRDHVTQLEDWQLIDAAFSGKARGHLSEAITRLEAGDNAGAITALTKLRAAIRLTYKTLDSETAVHALPPTVVSLKPVDDLRKLVNDYDRLLAARVLDFDAEYVSAQLPPVAVIPPASYDCNAPADDQICAPVTDADGTFVVRWGKKSCPKGPLDNSCHMSSVNYTLETSRDAQFLAPRQLYSGSDQQFEIHGAAPDVHYFRVTAEYRYCVRGFGYGYTPDYCDEDQGHYDTASDTYAQGPNKTVVDAP